MIELAGHDIFGDIVPVDGFYQIERDNFGDFVWSKKCFTVRRPPGLDYCSVHCCFNGESATLSMGDGSEPGSSMSILKGWHTYPLDFSTCKGEVLEFNLSRIVAVGGDSRELGLMFRRFRSFDSRAALELMSKSIANTILNEQEFSHGRVVLQSTPQSLRIASEDRCNMLPRCVYCDWETIKHQERRSGFTYHRDILSHMGRFFENAATICEVSFGEPLLNPHLGKLVEMIDKGGKLYEVTTNGLLLDEANRRKFLGRNVLMSVSIDAGSSEGYAKYRNDLFGTLIDNLRNLCREKKQHRNLPWVVVPFIAMPSNLGEIERFLDLMREVDVDLIKLRSLHAHPHLVERVVHRGGLEFRYRDEVLSLEELKEVYHRMAEWSRERGLALVSDLHLEQDQASGPAPLCSLPWRTMYVARNGINTCCYTRARPLANWQGSDPGPIEDFVESVWNGEQYLKIRSALAERRLPKHCGETPACPVNKRILGNYSGAH